jgi:hypothetical protein
MDKEATRKLYLHFRVAFLTSLVRVHLTDSEMDWVRKGSAD